MIDLKENEITYCEMIYPIEKWEVWFMTPMGLFQNLKEAKTRVSKNDMDPRIMIVPVAVAIGKDNVYEVFTRI